MKLVDSRTTEKDDTGEMTDDAGETLTDADETTDDADGPQMTLAIPHMTHCFKFSAKIQITHGATIRRLRTKLKTQVTVK